MADVTEKTIAGTQYRISKAGGRTGGRILFRGGQLFMQALAEGFGSKGDIDPTRVMASLFRRMSLDDYDWLCDEMAKLTTVGIVDPHNPGRAPTFVPLDTQYEEHFRGRFNALQEWLTEALKVNFASFLGEFLATMAPTKAGVGAGGSTSPLPTATTGSGSSGASSSAPG